MSSCREILADRDPERQCVLCGFVGTHRQVSEGLVLDEAGDRFRAAMRCRDRSACVERQRMRARS